jgi:hypothetical protein
VFTINATFPAISAPTVVVTPLAVVAGRLYIAGAGLSDMSRWEGREEKGEKDLY